MCLEQLSPTILNERTFDARVRFGATFSTLLRTRELTASTPGLETASLEQRIAGELQTLAHAQELYALAQHAQYSRHVIGAEGDWIGFICRWEANVASPIHGHPSFAYYQVLEGEYLVDRYEIAQNRQAIFVDTQRLRAGDCIWQQGNVGCYDNLVHRVRTTDTPGFTLHLFSEDPARGQHFELSD